MKNQVTEKWEDILNFMRDEYELTPVSYRTWIQPLKVSNVTNDTVIVSIDNKLGAPGIEHIEKKIQNIPSYIYCRDRRNRLRGELCPPGGQ